MHKFIYSFSIIIFGLALGYVVQVLVNRQIIKLPLPMGRMRKSLQYIALLFLNPVAIVGAIWIVNIRNVRIVAFPFLGLFALILGGGWAMKPVTRAWPTSFFPEMSVTRMPWFKSKNTCKPNSPKLQNHNFSGLRCKGVFVL